MPISVSNPTNGSVMTWPTTTFATMRTWLDAVPSTDLVDGTIEREHLVRPQVTGFPMQSQWSGFREHRWQDRHLDGTQLYDRVSWYTPEKEIIKPTVADRPGTVWNTSIGASLDTLKSRHRVWFSTMVLVRMNPALYLPAGALTYHTKVGELQIRAWNATISTETIISTTVADVFCGEFDSGQPSKGDLASKIDIFSFVPGANNHIYVVYKSVRTDVDQIDLDRVSFQVESA